MNQEQQDEIKRLGLIELTPCKEEKRRDENGNIIWRRNPDGTTEEWKFDENGYIIWRKNPEEATEEWKYDDRNNIIWHKYPNGTTEEWKYDNKDNVIWYKDTKKVYHIDKKEYRKAESLDKEELK